MQPTRRLDFGRSRRRLKFKSSSWSVKSANLDAGRRRPCDACSALIPSFGTKLSMIFAKEMGKGLCRRSRHTEGQMIGALKQVEAGRAVEDVAREVGVSKHTLYAWKAKYGGMEVSQAQEAKQLREENNSVSDERAAW